MTTPLFFLMGPTASGKTPLSLELTTRFPFEIVSVDSVMIYKNMDIGSAKPDKKIRDTVPHHLIDIVDPAYPYSAGKFREDALSAIKNIIARGKLPLLVGGTMLYFRVLQQGLAPLPRADHVYRAALTEEAAARGWPALHARLMEIDQVAAMRIHAHDSQRIQRALEVYHLTGRTISAFQCDQTENLAGYSIHPFAIAPLDRHQLHEHIAQRFAAMLQQGLIEEVAALFNRGDLNPTLPALRAVGYRQVWQYLAGEIDRSAMQAQALAATRQLAKRQLTWLRSWQGLQWFDASSHALFAEVTHWMRQYI